MNCSEAKVLISRRLDRELPEPGGGLLDAHLSACPECARHQQILVLPRRLMRSLPVPQPSPFFYQRLRAGILGGSRDLTVWQVTPALARYLLPALAAITLALLSLFTYQQIAVSPVDTYQAYETIFSSPDRQVRMIIADHSEITDESVLQAIAEEENGQRQPPRTGSQGK